MRRLTVHFIGSALVATGLLFWSGCSSSAESHTGHDHPSHAHARHAGHGEPGHVHEMGDENDHDADHTHVGPNGGRLIVLGDEDYHAELVIDHDRGEATVRILDQTGRKPVHIDQDEITLNVKCHGQPHQIRLAANNSTTTQPVAASCFTGSSDVLRDQCEVAGRLNVVIGGKPYTGRVAHHEDDHRVVR